MSRKLFLLHVVMFTVAAVPTMADWPMAGANPQRTSWVADEVAGDLTVAWYKPIEPFISQNVQIIAADSKLFISTARGLYALDASTGDLVWTYPTELPLGHSPHTITAAFRRQSRPQPRRLVYARRNLRPHRLRFLRL